MASAPAENIAAMVVALRTAGGSGIILTMTVGILSNAARGASHRHTSDPNAPPAASFSMRVSSKAHYGLRMMTRSGEHTSELQSPCNLVCRLLLEKKKT